MSREAFLIVENIEGEIEPNLWYECQNQVKVAIEQASEDKVELLKELYDLFDEE